MSSQFKNPLQRKAPPATQGDEWLVGGAQPAAPGDQSQGKLSLTGQKSPRSGGGLFAPSWQAGAQTPQERGASALANVVEQQTVKQPSMPGPNIAYSPKSPPQTPDTYVQGQHGRYGPGGNGINQLASAGYNNSPMSMPKGPAGAQMFAPTQRPGSPMGPGMPGGPASLSSGFNSFNQINPGSSFSMSGHGMGMVATPPAPGTFNPNYPGGTGALGGGPLGPGGNRFDGPSGRDPRSAKRKKKRKVPIWARVVIGVLLFLLVAGGVIFGYYQATLASSVGNIVGQQVQRTRGEEDPNANLTGGILGGSRVNILLLGSDTDQKFNGTFIAQTDIVVTIDPSSNTVGMLSIPRDFYINVPGYGMHKLDEAYGLGGVALSRLTIEQDFGIPINYYAWVGLDGFIKVIDEVGGVDVDVLHPIVDDNYPDDVGKNANNPYALKRLYLAPGPQHLDGPTALEYVRSRHADLVGDFGRSVRQQQVLSALKTKLANPDIFSKLSAIAKDLQGFLKTDMQLGDVLKLMNFARSLDPNKIQKLTLGPPYSSSGKSASGADVVLPNCNQIIPAIAKMLQLGDKAACNIQGNNGGVTNPLLAYTTGKPSPLANSINASVGGLSSVASIGGLPNDPSDLFGIHSLLDLLLMGVFESPDVF